MGEKRSYNLHDWLNILSENDASEVLSSVNNDGTGKGIDYDILMLLKILIIYQLYIMV